MYITYHLLPTYYQQPCEVICHDFYSAAEEKRLKANKTVCDLDAWLLSPNPGPFPYTELP